MRNLLIGAGVALGVLMGGSIAVLYTQPKVEVTPVVQSKEERALKAAIDYAKLKNPNFVDSRYVFLNTDGSLMSDRQILEAIEGACTGNLPTNANHTYDVANSNEMAQMKAFMGALLRGQMELCPPPELTAPTPIATPAPVEVEKPAIEVKTVAPKEVGGFEPSNLQIAMLQETKVSGATLIQPKGMKVFDPPSNLRSQPSTSSKVIHQFKTKGEPVIAIAQKADWFLVHNTNGRIRGWIHTSQVR